MTYLLIPGYSRVHKRLIMGPNAMVNGMATQRSMPNTCGQWPQNMPGAERIAVVTADMTVQVMVAMQTA